MEAFEKRNDLKIENLVLSMKDILFCILCCKQTFIEFLCFIYTQGFTTSCKSISNAVSVQSARKSQCWCVMIIFIKKKPVTSVPEVKSLFFLARDSENILSILFVELCTSEASDEWILQSYSALQLLVVHKMKSALLERIL